MRKRWIAACLGTVMAAGVFGGGAALSAATSDSAAVAGVGPVAGVDSPGPIRMLISGQIGRLLTLRSELNLSADQKHQIHEIIQAHKAEIAAALKPVVQKREALRAAVAAPETDESAIRSAASDLGSSIGDAAMVAAKVRGELWKVLTPDQQQKVADFRKASDKAVNDALDQMAKP